MQDVSFSLDFSALHAVRFGWSGPVEALAASPLHGLLSYRHTTEVRAKDTAYVECFALVKELYEGYGK